MRRLRAIDGFTLIELMVAIAILAVLVVIALPSFLGFRTTAQDRDAQSTLVNAEKMVTALGLEHNRMPSTAELLVLLPAVDGTFTWTITPDESTGPQVVSIEEQDGTEVALAVLSKSGACFYARVSTEGPSIRHADSTAVSCVADDFLAGVGSGW